MVRWPRPRSTGEMQEEVVAMRMERSRRRLRALEVESTRFGGRLHVGAKGEREREVKNRPVNE